MQFSTTLHVCTFCAKVEKSFASEKKLVNFAKSFLLIFLQVRELVFRAMATCLAISLVGMSQIQVPLLLLLLLCQWAKKEALTLVDHLKRRKRCLQDLPISFTFRYLTLGNILSLFVQQCLKITQKSRIPSSKLSFLNHFTSLWDHFQDILGQFKDHFLSILRPFLDHFEPFLAYLTKYNILTLPSKIENETFFGDFYTQCSV